MSSELIRNVRFFARPIEDLTAGPMTSVHSVISLDRERNQVRGSIHLRDCVSQISFDFWAGDGAKPGGMARADVMLGRLRDEIDAFLVDYETAVMELTDE